MITKNTMAELKDCIKIPNRYRFFEDGSLSADWSASGFTIRIDSEGGPFEVFYRSESDPYVSVWVDRKEAARPLLSEGSGVFSVELERGPHTVSVFRETEISVSGKALDLCGIRFSGTVLSKPEDRPFFLEVIGDSITCGDGSLGHFEEGVKWKHADHSATHSFAFFLASMLDADYCFVARGGIGSVRKAGAYEMNELYPYLNRYRYPDLLWKFDRTPDLLILEIGANDTKHSTEEEFAEAMAKLISFLRSTYGPGLPIVWFGKAERNYRLIREYEAKAQDPNFYAFRYEYGQTGSAALVTQKAGHPSAEDQKEAADALFAYLKEKKLC